MPDKIYITYRKGDSTIAESDKILAELENQLGSRFYQLTEADSDADILDLQKSIKTYTGIILLIGQRFASIVDEQRRPLLHDAYDYLHAELFAAIEADIPIVIVLTDDTAMPKRGFFPPHLRALVDVPRIRVETDDNIEKRVKRIRKLLLKQPTYNKFSADAVHESDSPVSNRLSNLRMPAVYIVLIVLGLAIFFMYQPPRERHTDVMREAGFDYWLFNYQRLLVASVPEGEQSFNQKCSACHGEITDEGAPYFEGLSRNRIPWEDLTIYQRAHGTIRWGDLMPFDDNVVPRDELYDIYAYIEAYQWQCADNLIATRDQILLAGGYDAYTERIPLIDCPESP